MKVRGYRQAFTIIEVLLFLAVTGMLFLVLVGGMANSVRRERYNDSLVTFKDLMQSQYAQVANVQNTRPLSERINCQQNTKVDGKASDGSDIVSVIVSNTSGKSAPGMSNCLIYGRWVEFAEGGKIVRLGNIIGEDAAKLKVEDIPAPREINLFKKVKISAESQPGGASAALTSRQLEWSAKLRQPNSTSAASGGFMILRSPLSGTIWTYSFSGALKVVSDNQYALSDVLTKANTNPRSLCVYSDDADKNRIRGLVIGGLIGSSNESAVQIAPMDKEVNGVAPVVCKGD
jgi:type II secretory pathway pseudopilin PulG